MRKRFFKILSVFLSITFLAEVLVPNYVFAGEVEGDANNGAYTSDTEDLVDLFTGTFKYSMPIITIPGSHGGGYSLSLNYNSDIQVDDDASWVGYGFSLSQGGLRRITKGFPDEYEPDVQNDLVYFTRSRPFWQASYGTGFGVSFLGSASWSKGTTFSSHGGYTKNGSFSNSFFGLGYTMAWSDGEVPTYMPSFSPSQMAASIVGMAAGGGEGSGIQTLDLLVKNKGNVVAAFKDFIKKYAETRPMDAFMDLGLKAISSGTSLLSAETFFPASATSRSLKLSPQRGFGVNLTSTMGLSQLYGSFNMRFTADYIQRKPVGYAKLFQIEQNKEFAYDYITEKGEGYDRREFHLGIPYNNYDIFIVDAPGLNGTFRNYNELVDVYSPGYVKNDIRYVTKLWDAFNEVELNIQVGKNSGKQIQEIRPFGDLENFEKESYQLYTGVDGTGSFFRFMGDRAGTLNYNNFRSGSQSLEVGNLPYLTSKTECATIYEKGSLPGLKEGLVYKGIQGIRYKDLYASRSIKPLYDNELISGFIVRNSDNSNYKFTEGLKVANKTILSVDVDRNALANPGDKIIYRNTNVPLLKIPATGSYGINVLGDDFYAMTNCIGVIDPNQYYDNFLLTEINANNYFDLNENTVADEGDLGGWTKFLYRKRFSMDDPFRFRSPYNGFKYEQGKKHTSYDDIGTMETGEKEVANLSVVETSTHIAFFITNESEKSHFLSNALEPQTTEAGDVNDKRDNFVNSIDNHWLAGSGNVRFDGVSAPALQETGDPAGTKYTDNTVKRKVKLEKIVLFSKNNPDHPVKTINFEYDYSLVKGIPNFKDVSGTGSCENNCGNADLCTGKLTLRRIWIENNGIEKEKKNLYEFGYNYEYPKNVAIKDRAYYESLEESEDVLYDEEAIDPWGYPQKYGKERNKYNIPWIYQGNNINENFEFGNNPSVEFVEDGADVLKLFLKNQSDFTWFCNPNPEYFDEYNWKKDADLQEKGTFNPAPYCLKKIVFPTGAELHIQYEQRDYAFVQDRPAMAMASCLASRFESPIDVFDPGKNTHVAELLDHMYISPEDLGADPYNEQQVTSLNDKINNYFYNYLRRNFYDTRNDYIYCQMLYNQGFKDYSEEYLSSWGDFYKSEVVSFKDKSDNDFFLIDVQINSVNLDGLRLFAPTNKARQDFLHELQGKTGFEDGTEDILEEKYEPKIRNFADKWFIPNWNKINSTEYIYSEFASKICNDMLKTYGIKEHPSYAFNYIGTILPQSFLRLPVFKNKKGGGVRVKRIFTYSPNVNGVEERISGKEYYYTLDGEISSGVATNEPIMNRAENPLVKYIKTAEHSKSTQVFLGSDKEQHEGPMGEGALPSASVGYSKVTVVDYNDGVSGNGYDEFEFNTCHDYPFDKEYLREPGIKYDFYGNTFDATIPKMEGDNMNNLWGSVTFAIDKFWVAQGYRYIHSNLNGSLNKHTHFKGEFKGLNVQPGSGSIYSIRENVLYEPGENVLLLDENFNVNYGIPGKEVDVAVEGKVIKDHNTDWALNLNLTIGFIPANFSIDVQAYYNESKAEFASHVTQKTINYPVIQKKVTSNTDGIIQEKEFVAFDYKTGKPVLTRIKDHLMDEGNEFNAGFDNYNYYVFTLPAYWKNSYMGHRPLNANHPNGSNYNTQQLSEDYASFICYSKIDDPLDFLEFVKSEYETNGSIPNVISSTAIEFTNQWRKTAVKNEKVRKDYGLTSSSSLVYGYTHDEKESDISFIPRKTFVYNESPINDEDISTPEKILSAGGQYTLDMSFTEGSKYIDNINEWKLKTYNTLYSPHGEVLEMKTRDGIYSAVLFSAEYDNNYPVMKAANAKYNTMYFNSFENNRNDKGIAHTGSYANKISNGTVVVENVYNDDLLRNDGGLIEVWIKDEADNIGKLQVQIENNLIELQRISKNGDWNLYSSIIEPEVFQSLSQSELQMMLKWELNNTDIAENYFYVDDVRFRPAKSTASSIVYDEKDGRVLASFDNQHFATFFKYDQEGKLVRKEIEKVNQAKNTIIENYTNIPERK